MQEQSITTFANVNVTLIEGKPMVSSLVVAEVFEKNHRDVLRNIRELNLDETDPEFDRRNFAPVEYVDAKGESRPAVNMTEEGFMLLVMGYTGPKAMAFKLAFIREFVRMRGELQALAIKEATRQAIHAHSSRESALLASQKPGAVLYQSGLALFNLEKALPDRADQRDLATAQDAIERIIDRLER